MKHTRQFTRHRCAGCRVSLKRGERDYCAPCLAGGRLQKALAEYMKALRS